MSRIATTDLITFKNEGTKFSMLTAYEFHTAKIAEEANIPVLLVGDSLGMVVLGYESTIEVTMNDMVHHTKPVARATHSSLIVSDLPFMSYQINIEQALSNATRLIQEGGAGAVKLEGGTEMGNTVSALTNAGIPVMGHIGLTPQSVHALGGYKLQGNTLEQAKNIMKDAKELEQNGAFAIVLELVPVELAAIITKNLTIPTIGIGAGPECDGQVQVTHDMLGLNTDFLPRHAKRYLELSKSMKSAFETYSRDVTAGIFPEATQSRPMKPNLLEQLNGLSW